MGGTPGVEPAFESPASGPPARNFYTNLLPGLKPFALRVRPSRPVFVFII